MDLEFAGRVVAITGGSRGPCLAIAERLADEGAAVAIAARSARELAEAHTLIEGRGGRCLAYACDLSVAGEAAAFIAGVVDIFGRLDGLVCNGGMALKGGENREAWQAELALNLGHAVEAVEAAASVMVLPAGILLVAGGGAGAAEAWPIAACRGALGEVARHFSRDLSARNIRVNHLVPAGPSFVDTAAFLLSPRSAGITALSLAPADDRARG